jgi:hypothetical protein
MEIVRVIGIIALIVFIVTFFSTLILPEESWQKARQILDYVSFGSLILGVTCGIIHLFA